MWAIGVTLYWLTHHGNVANWLRFGTLDKLFNFLKRGIFSYKGPLHQGSSTLDKLIAGCLDLSPIKRFTANQAVDMAKEYAAEKGLSELAIQSITQLSNIARVSLPPTWKSCMEKHCGYEQCVEQKDNLGKVQCGTHKQSELKLPPINIKHPPKNAIRTPVYSDFKLPLLEDKPLVENKVRFADLPAWLKNLPGKWVADYKIVNPKMMRHYEIVNGNEGYTLAVFQGNEQKAIGSFTIGDFTLKHDVIKLGMDYYSPMYQKETGRKFWLKVTIMPDPKMPDKILVNEDVSDWDPLMLDQFLKRPTGFRKVYF